MRYQSTCLWLVTVAAVMQCGGCTRKTYDPDWATQPYPRALHTTKTADMQVFRRGQSLEIVNSTARSYSEFDLWLNQLYVSHVDSLPAGKSITLSLWDFRNEFGDAFNAGGFFRAYESTPVRLVEIQPGPDQPMIGLITIRSEDVKIKSEPGR